MNENKDRNLVGAAKPHRSRGLDRSLASGVAWMMGATWSIQVITWASTLVVIRLLTPSDFGLVAMAEVFIGLVLLLSEFGLGAAVVALRDLTDRQICQINTLSIAFGFAAFGASFLASGPIGTFFSAPELPLVVVTIGITFIISSVGVIPESLLKRDLKFKQVALIGAASATSAALVTLALAFLGFGYWSLVVGNIVRSLVKTLLTLCLRRRPLVLPELKALTEVLSFTANIITSRVAWYAYSNADFLIVGRVLGQDLLGLYSIGWELASIPIRNITSIVAQVTPSVFSEVQESSDQLRRYFVLITEGLAVVTFPITVGLALVADDFVLLVMGDQWSEAVVPLRLLSIYASFRSLTVVFPHVFNVTGDSKFTMRYSLLAAAGLIPAFLVATRWGLSGVAASWVLIHPLVSFPALRRVLRTVELPLRDYVALLWPALSSVSLMAGTVMSVGSLLGDLGHGGRLAAQIGAGVISYLGAMVLLHRGRIDRIRRATALLLGRKQSR